jgi:hypothetical protein
MSRFFTIVTGVSLIALTQPAAAVGLGDLAKVVLGGGSVLKKAEQACGPAQKLTTGDSLALTFARAAAEQALPLSQFALLDQSAEDEATTASQSTGFCKETKAKKPSLMKKIKAAGKALLKSRM